MSSTAQSVDVLVRFVAGKIQPIGFRRGHCSYPIQKIYLIHSERRGREKITHFSVSDGVNSFRLSFFADSYRWYVEEQEVL